MTYLKAATAMTLEGYARLFVDCIFFKWDFARFLLTSASCGSSAIAELLVKGC